MTVRFHAARCAALATAIFVPAFAQQALAQFAGGALTGGEPTHIEAQQGIEWQQSNRVYIARGNATAARGQSKVTADVLYAYYRPVAQQNGSGAKAPANAKPAGTAPANPAAPSDLAKGANPINSDSATEIYRFEADGHVVFTDGDRIAYGDHAVYDVDQAVLVVTGKNLRIESPRESIAARDMLEWYDKKQLAVARGDAVAIREDHRMRADIITAEVARPENQAARIQRVNGYGNVLVSAPDQIAHGDEGVYNLDTGIATLIGHVRITKGDNELRGQYGVVDTKNSVSRILAEPPGTQVAADGKRPRVEGLLVPNRKPDAGAAPASGGKTTP